MGLALVLSASAMGAAGCTTHNDASEEESLGMLRLPLVTPVQGSYRLHSATFVIKTQNGTTIATLDSDTDPDAQALTVALSPSDYTVLLQDGWELDSVAGDGTETPIQAALISANPQSFNIKSATDTDLTFTFTTAYGVVNIGNGTANVTVDVTSNVGLTACDVVGGYYNACPSGKTCLLADATGRGFCGNPGTLPVGSLCSSEQCVAGSQCLKADPSNPSQGICTDFCDTTATNFGCNCVSLGFASSNVGICGPTPQGSCDMLAQTGCAAGEACQYTGGSFGTCGTPGATPTGDSCSSETCVAGATCHSGTCMKFCDTNVYTPGSGCYCTNVGTGDVGRCT
jgi:hypothetical protein